VKHWEKYGEDFYYKINSNILLVQTSKQITFFDELFTEIHLCRRSFSTSNILYSCWRSKVKRSSRWNEGKMLSMHTYVSACEARNLVQVDAIAWKTRREERERERERERDSSLSLSHPSRSSSRIIESNYINCIAYPRDHCERYWPVG